MKFNAQTNAVDYITRLWNFQKSIKKLSYQTAVLEQEAKYQHDPELKVQVKAKARAKRQKMYNLVEQREEILETVRIMSMDYSRILILHHMYGESFEKIARDHNRKPDYIKQKYDEGMLKLQRILDMRQRTRQIEEKYGRRVE